MPIKKKPTGALSLAIASALVLGIIAWGTPPTEQEGAYIAFLIRMVLAPIFLGLGIKQFAEYIKGE